MDYAFPAIEGINEEVVFAKHYIPSVYSESTKNSLIYFPIWTSGQAGYTFIDGNQFINVQNADLENNFSIQQMDYYGYGKAVDTPYDKVELKKIEREPLTVLGKTCNHYDVLITKDGEAQPSDFVLCIDETSEIDNTSFLLPKQEGKQIKGLVLAVTSPEGNENERILLKSIHSVASTIQFNLDKELAAYQVRKDSLQKVEEEEELAWEATDMAADAYDSYYNYMTQPKFCDYMDFYKLKFSSDDASTMASSYLGSICSYTYYLKRGDEEKYKEFALKEIKGMKKNLPKTGLISKKDAEMFYEFLKKDIEAMELTEPLTQEEIAAENAALDAEYAANLAAAEAAEAVSDAAGIYDEYEPYVYDYHSTYQTLQPEDSSFAVTSLNEDSNYWKGMPVYCKKLETIVPQFSDEEITKHAKNYAGQICDMYLGEFEGTSVWHKGTLDAIRSEQLYFNNNRDKFSKKDRELLNEFLNNLD